MVQGCQPLINSSKGDQEGRMLLTYNPHLSDVVASGSYPKGLTQLPFVLTRALEGATLGSIEGTIP